MGAFVEQHAIEHTVDNVSQGSRQDQRHTDDKSGLHALLHELVPVSYTHLRAHETGRNLVCRLLLEKKKKEKKHNP